MPSSSNEGRKFLKENKIKCRNTKSTYLTDINDDCLEKIFKYLSLDDLLNIAETSKQLKTAVDWAFNFKFRGTLFEIDTNCICKVRQGILISDIRKSFRLLRCFGQLIPYLAIFQPLCYGKYLISYLDIYCSESLETIKFFKVNIDLSKYLKRQFLKVVRLTFYYCRHLEMYKLKKFFPHIVQATLNECKLLSTGNLHFPHLNRIFSQNTENITPFIRENPQVHDLRLDNHYTCKVNAFLEHLGNLEFLSMFNILPQDLYFDKTVCLNNLRMLYIEFRSTFNRCEWNFNPERFICDQLEWLHISVGVGWNSNLIKFIIKFPTIKNLNLLFWDKTSLSEEYLMEIARGLPLLEKVCLNGYVLTVDEVIRFIGACKNLKIFCCIALDQPKPQELTSHLGEDWKVFITSEPIHTMPTYLFSSFGLPWLFTEHKIHVCVQRNK